MSEQQTAEPMELQNRIAMILGVALKALSVRLMSIIGMFLIFSLFGWVVYDPSVLKIVAASLFAIAEWAILKLEHKESKNG